MARSAPPNPFKGTNANIGVDPSPATSSSSAIKHACIRDNQDSSQSIRASTKANASTTTDAAIIAKDHKDIDAEDDQDDANTEMPKPRPQPVRRDADISLVLTPAQRVDMLRLNEAIHAKVEEQIMKPYNYLHVPVAQINRVRIWNYGPVVAAQMPQSAAEAGNANTVASTKSSTGNANGNGDSNKPGKEQGEAQENAAEVTPIPRFIPKVDANSVKPTVSSMSVLKDETTQYFNKWKLTFNKRFNDLVIPNQSSFNGGPSRQGQGVPRGGGAGAGSASRFGQQVNKGNAYQADLYLIRRFQPVDTPLCNLPVDKRRLLIHAMILMLISTEHYISYSRIYMLYLASSLHIPSWVLLEEENRIARSLGKIYKTLCEQAEARELEEKRQAEEAQKIEEARRAAQGLDQATVDLPEEKMIEQAGVAQDAQQAQQAHQAQESKPVRETKESKKKWRPSPNPVQVGMVLLNAGIGMIEPAQGLPAFSFPPTTVTHLIGPLGDCETAVGIFFGVNPSRPNMKSLSAVAQGLGDGAFIPLHGRNEIEIEDPKDIAPDHRRMRLVLCVNGLLVDKDDLTAPWECLGHHKEVYAVRWETDTLNKIGGACEALVRSKCWPEAVKKLSGIPIMTTMNMQAWPASLVRASKIVDNAWIMGFSKCSKLASVLGDTIVTHVLGERGLTLLGYGLGARAIYQCLTHLAERKMYGLVDTVVLMGAPIPSDAGTWSVLKSVVTGRLVNVYSPTDYMLAFAARQGAYMYGIAGLEQVQGVGGVENHDVSDILDAHLNYPTLVPTILKRIGWEDLKRELKPPPPQPKAPAAVPQKTHTTAGKRFDVGTIPSQARVAANENKENSLPRRGGKSSRGGGGGGGRGGRGNSNVDKRIADQMGRMNS